MAKKLAIIQSGYIPWKGYFDIINMVDEFILFDDMQYTRRDWRNRNRIKTREGLRWLSIPVKVKGNYLGKICEIAIADPTWNMKHWASIRHSYSEASYFRYYEEFFKDLYLSCNNDYLSEVNFRFIDAVCKILGISTKLSWSMDYDIVEGKTERLVSICKQAGATEYVSGPSANSYLDAKIFEVEGIKLTWVNYSGYSEYNQLYPPFEHEVTILDLILNEGPRATRFLKSFEN